MKVMVTGATGTAGQGIVKACLADERVTKVLIVTRRTVAKEVEKHAKVEVTLHEDFSNYPDELMAKLQGAEACFWAIGGRVDRFGNDKALARKVGVDYTLAGAKAVCTSLSAGIHASTGRKFQFVFCSGVLSEWDQSRRLFFLEDSRKIKGSIEEALCKLADGNSETFEVWIARPSGLIGVDAGLHKKVFGQLYRAIGTEHLGRAMISIAVDGWKERIVGNEDLMRM